MFSILLLDASGESAAPGFRWRFREIFMLSTRCVGRGIVGVRRIKAAVLVRM